MILFNFTFYSIVCLVFIILINKRDRPIARAGIIVYTLVTIVWLWVTLSFREPTGDPWRYILGLNKIADLRFLELLNYEDTPIGFALLNWLITRFSTNSIVFFSIIYLFCIGPLYFAFRERFNKVESCILIMLYLLYPFYVNNLGNIFKQGIASGFMLWGLNNILDRNDLKWFKGLLLLLVSTLFHSSFWLVNIALVIWYFIYRKRPVSWSVYTLIFFVISGITGIIEPIVAYLLPDELVKEIGFSNYFDEEFLNSDDYLRIGYTSGFRLDFTIFTIFPLLVYYFIRNNIYIKSSSKDFIRFYCIIASSYFILLYIPFSDRIASFSWFLMPFILFNQFKKIENKNHLTNFIIILLIIYPILMLTYTKGFFK